MIEAKIDKEEIEKLRAFFNATQKQLDNAIYYTLKSTAQWLKSQLIKGTAKESRIQQKPLTEKTSKGTSRFWSEVDKKEQSARLWFGTRRISLARLNPKQYGKKTKGRKKGRKASKAGVSAGVGGSIFREGAFLMPIRKKDGSAAIVPYQVMKRVGRERLPLEKQVFDYSDKAVAIEEKLRTQVPQKLTDILRSKLKWQTEKN